MEMKKISVTEIENLEDLVIEHNLDVNSIEGIEKAVNLQYITIVGCSLQDISPITELENLVAFWLNNNEISDVSCLQNVKFVEQFSSFESSLAGNFIDFTQGNANYNAYMYVLENSLDGEYNNGLRRDIYAQNYGTLEQRFDEVVMQDALKNKLIEQGVDLDKDGIITQYEMYCVGDGVYGPDFSLSYANITDLSGVEYLSNQSYIDISHNQITDITPLTRLTGLEGVDMSHNQITTLEGLEACKLLTHVTAKNNRITDITPLTQLHYASCDFEDCLTPYGFSGVYIDLAYNAITDVAPVLNLHNLSGLHLNHKKIQDISCLQNYEFLEEIDEETGELWFTYVVDFRGNYIDVEAQETQNVKTMFEEKGVTVLLSKQQEVGDVLKGDVNQDGRVALYDAFKILEAAILGTDLTPEQIAIMDYNEDGKVSLYDAFKFLEVAILG